MESGIRRHAPVDVLVVDDDQVFADTLAQRLAREPAVRHLEPVYSSEAALECLRSRRPDVVLLDYNLSDASSLSLLLDIQAMAEPPTVLILSGSHEVADIAHALDYGASGWVVKGVPVADLLGAVDRALAGELVLPEGAVAELVHYLIDQLHRRGTSP